VNIISRFVITTFSISIWITSDSSRSGKGKKSLHKLHSRSIAYDGNDIEYWTHSMQQGTKNKWNMRRSIVRYFTVTSCLPAAILIPET